MNKKIIILFALATFLILPVAVFAISYPDMPGDDLDIRAAIDGIFAFIWPIFIAIAMGMFIWAGFLYLTANGEVGKLSLAGKAVIGGTIGLAIAFLASSMPFIVNNILFPPPPPPAVCGDTAPACDGTCPAGQACIVGLSENCICN